MKTCNLQQKWATAANLPAVPEIASFVVRKNSSMAKLQKAFNEVGLAHHTGRGHVFACTPSDRQVEELKKRGIDVSYQRSFSCSPRRG